MATRQEKQAKDLEAAANAEQSKATAAREALEAARAALAKAEADFADGVAAWPTKEREAVAQAEVKAARAQQRAEEARARMIAARAEFTRAQYADAIARCSDERFRKDLEPAIAKLEDARRLATEALATIEAAVETQATGAADAKRHGKALGMDEPAIADALVRGYVGDHNAPRDLAAARTIVAARLGAFVARANLRRDDVGGWIRAVDPGAFLRPQFGERDALPAFLEAPGLLARVRG